MNVSLWPQSQAPKALGLIRTDCWRVIKTGMKRLALAAAPQMIWVDPTLAADIVDPLHVRR
ncbi:hypothetical protein [Mesorhizobium sp.]|uniref:hypothetical protein n=1 Tax=Mesorhizobium sp. TaxID=1871066 RepID=UPI0025C05D6B|nr:hypothetical protein [Mesorhizobium sp.]